MRIRLSGGRIFDPIHGEEGTVRDLLVEDGRIVDRFSGGEAQQVYDLEGAIVMAGGIDLHSHIGGGKVVIARELMGDEHREHRHVARPPLRGGSGIATPSTFETGYAYARMGYTMAFEPAMLPVNARAAHLEMADIPILDKGAYVLLGSDDFLLGLLAAGEQAAVRDYVGWTLEASRGMAIKIVNPGGIEAFKWGMRRIDLDEPGPHYGITPRRILTALAEAVDELGMPHPIHVHGCHLGLPGSRDTTLATIRAMEGRRIHLTHVQFHAYGSEGKRGFSSGAAEIAELVNASPNVSLDVGQVMFGQTITASGDTMSQMRTSRYAHPRRWLLQDIECEAGCGVVPFRYRHRNFVHALQWVIGLELFLLVEDPWRIALTTDHPNGAPFSTYPHLMRLLMDRDYRTAQLERLPAAVREVSHLAALEREYTLSEIAIVTRAGPARLLGIDGEYGHLGTGARADIAVYAEDADIERMFAHPLYVFRNGEPVVEKGKLRPDAGGRVGRTHTVEPGYDPAIRGRLARFYEDWRGSRLTSFEIDRLEFERFGDLQPHACRAA